MKNDLTVHLIPSPLYYPLSNLGEPVIRFTNALHVPSGWRALSLGVIPHRSVSIFDLDHVLRNDKSNTLVSIVPSYIHRTYFSVPD